MWYLTEEFRWDIEGERKYYHIVDSKITKSSILGVGSHHINGSLIEVTIIDDYEAERYISRKRRNE